MLTPHEHNTFLTSKISLHSLQELILELIRVRAWKQDWDVSLSLWLVSAANFISRALEASSSIDSHLLLLKFASRRLGITRGASSLMCAPPEICITLSLVVFDSEWPNPPLWLIEWGKGLADNPALGELLNGEVAPLVRMSFRINLVSLVLVAT